MSNKFEHASPAGLSGKDIMRRINDGDLQKAPIHQIEQVKREISDNCEELIEMGARIRPLLIEGKQIGWVRGLHPQERKMFRRWIKDPNDFVLSSLLLATTFSKEEVEAMPALEIKSLAEVVRQMGEYDLSLFPYLSAYATTQSSENLWFGQRERLTSYENRMVTLPDSKQIKIMAPPDHARMWASLCNYREQAKRRLEENFNALFIVRPHAGKSADPIALELKGVARQLETNSIDPWEKCIKAAPQKNVNDGWAHAGDSVEDLQRELKGMLEGDKHERLMEIWQKQMQDEAEERQRKLEALRIKRGTNVPGIVEERVQVFTDKEIKERQKALKQGKQHPGALVREDFESDPTERHNEKMRNYK